MPDPWATTRRASKPLILEKQGVICHHRHMKIEEFELQDPLPALREPHAISILRPWVDAGNVGTVALFRLEQALGAQEIGRLAHPGEFFDFTRYRPQTQQVDGRRTLSVPNTVISYAKGGELEHDFLFLRVLEPHASAERYIASLVAVLKLFKVKRYCRIGAMYDAVPHTRPLKVTGTLGGQPISGVPGLMPQTRRGIYQGPTTIMGLLNEELEREGVENMTLMARLPQYLQLDDDYTGAARMLEVLSQLYKMQMEISETEKGHRQYSQADAEVGRYGPARELVDRLEAIYDADTSTPPAREEEKETPLSPEVQQFLRDLGTRLDNPRE